MENHQDNNGRKSNRSSAAVQSRRRRRLAHLSGTENNSSISRQWRNVLLPTTLFFLLFAMISYGTIFRQAHFSTSGIFFEGSLLEQQQDPTKRSNHQRQDMSVNRNDTHAWKGGTHKKNEHFSACVKILDENDALIEWLAFHYHTLSLRRIIFLVDQGAVTTPEAILKRWEGRINITLWNIQDVFPNPEDLPEGLGSAAKNNRRRQSLFHHKCIDTLLDEEAEHGHRWVSLFDPDEYIAINDRVWDKTDAMYNLNIKDDEEALQPPSSPSKAGSTLEFIQDAVWRVSRYGIKGNKYLVPFETPCINVARKQYGTYETNNTQDDNQNNDKNDPPFAFQPDQGITPSNLKTWRWRYWGGTVNGKVIIDLSRINRNDVSPIANVHRPLASFHMCRVGLMHANEDVIPLVMNHYPATLEQQLYRSGDARGNGNGTAYRIERYEKERNIRKFYEPHSHIKEWLSGFVESVGSDEALRLLQHAGNPQAANTGAYSTVLTSSQ